jgi:hypothetical protein
MGEKGFIRFLKWNSLYEKERPFQIFTDVLPNSPDQRKTNLLWDQKQIELEDFREKAAEFELDTHGFTTHRLSGFDDLLDKNTAVSHYLSAVEKMLQEELQDAGTVFIFDWRVRRANEQFLWRELTLCPFKRSVLVVLQQQKRGLTSVTRLSHCFLVTTLILTRVLRLSCSESKIAIQVLSEKSCVNASERSSMYSHLSSKFTLITLL